MDQVRNTAIVPGLVFVLFAWGPAARAAELEPLEFFEKKVRPVLVQHCYACHSATAKKLRGGLLLDSREGLLKGGDTGPALVPGKPEASHLVEAISYQSVELRMPPRAKLPDATIADLTTWIKLGAPWPTERKTGDTIAKHNTFDLAARKAAHWAWKPVTPRTAPAVRDASWPLDSVDSFILAKLEKQGLPPAAPADRRTLLRRLYFDLIGLPPSPAEVEAFVHDEAPDTVTKVVDRLLASQHFGERWGRHWLDLVRYAESRGHEFDYTTPNAYQYRDYVIRALNADVPYDQFVKEHLGGDLLPSPRLHRDGFNESILGTGFWYLGEQLHSPVDLRQDEAERLDNMVDVFSKTFLGLTVSCARCHDHKFDAISTKDYYALLGFLESSSYRQVRFDALEHNRQIAPQLADVREKQRPVAQRLVAEALRPSLEKLAERLLDAGDLLRTSPEGRAESKEQRAWLAELEAASKTPAHPLHAWARFSVESRPETLRALVDRWHLQDVEAASPLAGVEIVADYRRPGATPWLSDGLAFGQAPVQAGMVRWGETPERPLTRIYQQAAAEQDPFWACLREAPGTEAEPGTQGNSLRPGRMLRTPSFTVTSGKLYYLVRGAGKAFAVVNSHIMLGGPLHGQTLQKLKSEPGTFQWIAHDLTAYQGHRAHVEFLPGDDDDFAIALAVQSSKPPGRFESANAALLRLLEENPSHTLETLAAGYQHLFQDAAERLGQDRILHAAGAEAFAPLADWLVQHLDLLLGEKEKRRMAEVVEPLLAWQQKLLASLRKESRLAPAMLDGNGVEERVFIRGSPRAPGPVAPRRFLEALVGSEPIRASGSGRLELARQVTDPQLNPFLARVAVNRVWHHLFGRGIVPSVDNFGVLGELPSHPELLDALADRFGRDGWSFKRLIRSLVLSRTYQTSAQQSGPADAADPENVLLHRMRVRRLEGEAIRDALLVVSGQADLQPFGPPVPVHLTSFQDGRGRPTSGPLDGKGRRSVYLAVRRNFLAPFLVAFDTPIPFSTVGRRTVSNVPGQALILLNDPFVHQQAQAWARRVVARPSSSAERIAGMYLTAFGRPPAEDELSACLEFLQQRGSPDDVAAWTDLAHVLFNMKEFIFLN